MEQKGRMLDPGSDLPRRRRGVMAWRRWAFGDLRSQAEEMMVVWGTLTVVRPAGVKEMVPVRGEGHIQDAPAYIPGLDALEFMKAAIPAVIQSDRLVCVSGDQAELGNTLLESSLDQTFLTHHSSVESSLDHGMCSS